MVIRHIVIMIALLVVVSVWLNRSHCERCDEPAAPVLVTPWYWGTICFDSDFGHETVEALLYIAELRPRGYFLGALWYPEANEILEVVGRLTPAGYLCWFCVLYPLYAPDLPVNPRGERMFFYKNLGYDYGIRRAIGGVLTKATWHLQPVSLEQQEQR